MSLFSFLVPGTRAVPFSSACFSLQPRTGQLMASFAAGRCPSFLHITVRGPFLSRTPDSQDTVPLKNNARPDGEIRSSRLVSSDGVRPGAEMMGEGKRRGGGHSSARLWRSDSLSLVRRAPCPGPSLLPFLLASFLASPLPRGSRVVEPWPGPRHPPTPVL